MPTDYRTGYRTTSWFTTAAPASAAFGLPSSTTRSVVPARILAKPVYPHAFGAFYATGLPPDWLPNVRGRTRYPVGCGLTPCMRITRWCGCGRAPRTPVPPTVRILVDTPFFTYRSSGSVLATDTAAAPCATILVLPVLVPLARGCLARFQQRSYVYC